VIEAGDSRLTNKDDRDYTWSPTKKVAKSDNLGKGETFQHTFTKPGRSKRR